MAFTWLKKWLRPADQATSANFERYVSELPSYQNAVNSIPGWNTAFPPKYGLTAGTVATYNDPRILWAIAQFGSLQDRHVLELGPLEGGHTSLLESQGAVVESIEANQLAFMRCLITKEILGLTRSKFWLGDFMKALESWDRSYDLIVACGVLYHLKEPLRLVELAAQRTNALYLWTHVVTEEDMPPSDPRRAVFALEAEEHDFHGVNVRAYRRTYARAEANVTFCGGISDDHRWLHRDDLLRALGAVGFTNIETSHNEPQHPFGPALSIFAKK